MEFFAKIEKSQTLASISTLIIKTESNSSSFINEIKQLFLVYLISVLIRNSVVYIQTKNVKKNLLTCFVSSIYFILFFKPAVWEREKVSNGKYISGIQNGKREKNGIY